MLVGVEVIKPNEHWRALDDVAAGIAFSLDKLDSKHRIVFNAQHARLALDDGSIIYNAEQVPVQPYAELTTWWRRYVDLMRRHVVWDYSATNIERLKRLGIGRAVHCRVGWWPGLERVSKMHDDGGDMVFPVEQDIDVLFIGSINDRRERLLFEIGLRGMKVKTLFGVYGEVRDRWLARSKVILNTHYYENPIHEVFRTSYMLANRKCVVTEGGGCDIELEQFAAHTMGYESYDQLAELCSQYVRDKQVRQAAEKYGYTEFRKIDQVAEVKRALEETE